MAQLGQYISDGSAVWAVNNVGNPSQDAAVHNATFRGAELTESWESLKNRVQNGDFSNIYIGDYKQITLTTGEVVIMEVAGINLYKGHGDFEIGHHIDFISRDCLSEPHRFNATITNNGTAEQPCPWLASELYQTLNDESSGVYATLPSDLKSHIITKRAFLEERYSSAGTVSQDTRWSAQPMGKLWIPTEIEVFGRQNTSDLGYGTGGCGCNLRYPIFCFKGIIKGKGNEGSRCAWWMASASRKNSTSFCAITHFGDIGDYTAINTGIYVLLCFRIG